MHPDADITPTSTPTSTPWHDRAEAGRQLAAELESWRGTEALVVGLPRGGVPVAAAIATALELPLDVVVVRKLGLPGQPEVAMGALGEGGVRVLNQHVARTATAQEFAHVERAESAVLRQRLAAIRAVHARLPMAGRPVIVVDDGLATGATARAAVAVVRAQGASEVVVAAPVASPSAAGALRNEADEVVVLLEPSRFRAVGQFYEHFEAVSDPEVISLLSDSDGRSRPASGARSVAIPVDGVSLAGSLHTPPSPIGVVIFAHGSGSSRHSPRNRTVAAHLTSEGLATVLVDLLTEEEENRRLPVFEIELLAPRLASVVTWVRDQPPFHGLPVFLFGASTGSAAALAASVRVPVDAIVSRGGRPDLAADVLDHVHAPTLLIVGSADTDVLALNRAAQKWMHCESALAVVPGATHLFSEPGALDEVARLATHWFLTHLPVSARME